MKIGDLVEKYKGYIPDVRVGIVTGFPDLPADRVEVLCSDGFNYWLRTFVRVIEKNDRKKPGGKT
jgi:hypothetical protein